MKKALPILLIGMMVLSIIPIYPTPHALAANYSETEFFAYLVSIGQRKYTQYSGLKANVDTYNRYNLIVYDKPHGDTKCIDASENEVDCSSSAMASVEHRYLGYNENEDGYRNNNEPYTNPLFPPDVTGSQPPENWNFIPVPGGPASWGNVIDSNQANHMLTAPLYGNGATSLTVQGIGGKSYAKIQSPSTLRTQGSVYTLNTSGGKTYYASFTVPALAGNSIINGSISTPQHTYTISAGEQSVNMPMTAVANANTKGAFTKSQITDFHLTLEGENSPGTSGDDAITYTRTMTYSRDQYAVGSHPIKLEGQASLTSVFPEDGTITEGLTPKNITLIVEPEGPDPVLTGSLATDPAMQPFADADVPVTVTSNGQLSNFQATHADKIERWDFYIRKEDGGTTTKKELNSQNTSESVEVDFTIPASAMSGQDNFTQNFVSTVRIFFTEEIPGSIKAGHLYYIEDRMQASTLIYRADSPADPVPEPEPPATPPPTNDPPVAKINTKNSVKAGETFFVNGNQSFDPDGTIIDYVWEETANGSLSGANGGSVWYSNVGTEPIGLCVVDDDGAGGCTAEAITVTEPTPDARIKPGGTLKENRRVELDFSASSSPTHFPLNWSQTEFTITPITSGLSSSDIQIHSSSTDQKVIAQFKKAGDYRVEVTVENSAGYSDTAQRTIRIVPDEKPVAQFAASAMLFRQAEHDYKARIEIFNQSYSPDGDLIDRNVWKIIHDSDNDGVFTDNSTLTINDASFSDGQTKTYSLGGQSVKVQVMKADQKVFVTVPKVGDYRIEAVVTEDFYQPYIAAFVSSADFRQASSFATKDASLSVVRVDNLPPIVDFQMTERSKVNLQVALGDTQHSDPQLVESKINSIVVPQLAAQNIEAEVSVTQTLTPTDHFFYLGRTNWFLHLDGMLVSGGEAEMNLGHSGYAGYVEAQSLVDDAKQISSSESHTLALLSNGRVAAWGEGRLGTGGGNAYTPALVRGGQTGSTYLQNVTKVVADDQTSSFALLSNRRVVSWGNNSNTRAYSDEPQYVVGGESGTTYLENVEDILVNDGRQVFFHLTNGKVMSVGTNQSGMSGAGHTSRIYTPEYVVGGQTGTTHLSQVEKLKISRDGFSVYALLSSGRVASWGSNLYGQLGNGSTTQQSAPVYMRGGETGSTYLENAKDIFGGYRNGFVLLENGKAVAMGNNSDGQLGINNTTYQRLPVYVKGGQTGSTHLSNIHKIVSDQMISAAVLNDGHVVSWGWAKYGKSGTGTSLDHLLTPQYVSGGESGTARLENAVDLYTSGRATFAILADGLMVWGDDYDLTRETGYQIEEPAYLQAGNEVRFPIKDIGEAKLKYISTSLGTGVQYLQSDSQQAYCSWITNRLDVGCRGEALASFLQISGETIVDWVDSFYLTNSGRILSSNTDYTTSGRGLDSTDEDIPPIGAIDTTYTDFVKIYKAGGATFGLRADGRIMAWGRDSAGQQGDGYHHNNDYNQSPKLVKNVYNAVDMLNAESVYALTQSGDLFSWGNEQNTPQKVLGNVRKIMSGNHPYYILALLADGSLYAVRDTYSTRVRYDISLADVTAADMENGFIYLADGKMLHMTTYRYASDPIPGGQAGGTYLTRDKVQHVASDGDSFFVLLNSGRVLAWGENPNGQLGVGSQTDVAVPTYVKGGITGTTYLEDVKSVQLMDSALYVVHPEYGLLYSGRDNDQVLHTRDTTYHTTPVLFDRSGRIPFKLYDMPTANQAYAETAWSSNEDNFYLYFQDSEAKDLRESSGRLALAAQLANDQAALIGLGTSANQAQLQQIIGMNASGGKYYNNSNLDGTLDQLVDFIAARAVPDYPVVTERIALREDANGQYRSKSIETMSFYEDPERDPMYDEQYHVVHDPTVYENHQGTISGSVFSTPMRVFTKVGKYELTYKAQDNPTGSTSSSHPFQDYRKWSEMSKFKRIIYIHRAPKALFTAATSCGSSSCSVAIQNQSYDLDRYSTSQRGIVQFEWQYRKSMASSWTTGKRSSISKGDVYIQKLRVKDSDGAWSDPYTVVLDGSGSSFNQPPVAQFVVTPGNVSVTGTTTIQDHSFDPDGDAITQRDWTVIKNGAATVHSGSSQPGNIADYGVGRYEIRLRVSDGSEWSNTHVQQVEVVNYPPEALFTLPEEAYRDTLLRPDNLTPTTDRDGHNVSYRWKAKLGAGTTINLGTAREPGFRVLNWGLGTSAVSGGWLIELTATDSTGKSSVFSRPLEVLNRQPVAVINGVASTRQYSTRSFTSGSSDPDSEDSLRHAWTLTAPSGSLQYGSGTSFSHTYSEAGTHSLELTVTDPLGEADTDTLTINVAPNTPPLTTLQSYKSTSGSPVYTRDTTPTLQVQVMDAENHPIRFVDYEVYSVTSGEWVVNTQSSAMSYTPAALADGKYYWRARAYDGYDIGPYSSVGYFFIDTKRPADVDEQLAPTADSVTVTFNAFSDPSPSSGHATRRFYMQKWNGSAAENIDIDGNGSTEYSLIIPKGSTSYTVSNLASASEYRLTVIDWDRAGNQGYYSYIYFTPNRPPTADFNWSPQPVWEGEEIALQPAVSDPDGDPLQINYAVTKPDGSALHDSSSTIQPPYVVSGPRFTAAAPGSYTVKVTVSDGLAERVEVVKVIQVGALSITGRVRHTDDWEAYRQAYNEAYPEQPRDHDVFWAGEIFMLEAETTDLSGSLLQVERVEVEMTGADEVYETELQQSAEIKHEWKGELWQEEMAELDDGSYLFHFTARWSQGVEKTFTVTVEMIDSIWHTVGVHRRF